MYRWGSLHRISHNGEWVVDASPSRHRQAMKASQPWRVQRFIRREHAIYDSAAVKKVMSAYMVQVGMYRAARARRQEGEQEGRRAGVMARIAVAAGREVKRRVAVIYRYGRW